MKLVKIYLGIVLGLLVVGLGFGIYVWYTIQTLSVKAGTTAIEVSETIIPVDSSSSTLRTPAMIEPVTIETTKLPESQQEVLKSFGYGSETITITSDMVSCAEDSIGKKRLEEILNGGAPTPLESIKLIPCFKQ